MAPSTPSVLILICSLLFSMYLSTEIAQRRTRQSIRTTQTFVRAGFNKVLSQIAWMRLIQFRGSLQGINKENASILNGKYDHLTNLDPQFSRAYEEGALEIGWQLPDEAIALLDKAREKGSVGGWRLPFLAGFIAKNRQNNIPKAIKYLEEADKQSYRPSFVRRFLINLKAQEGYASDPMAILKLWVDYYTGLARSGAMSGMQGRTLGPDMIDFNQNFESDAERSLALNQIRRVSAKIIEDTQKNITNERDPARKTSLQGRITETEKIVQQIYAGKHICPQCFRPYIAGDEFCGFDGKKLVQYGVCQKCRTVLRGALFCPKCGEKAN